MANHHPPTLPVEVEFEYSRLASQYLVDAYAQVLPELRSASKDSKAHHKFTRVSIQEV